jgi:hypothetical protein
MTGNHRWGEMKKRAQRIREKELEGVDLMGLAPFRLAEWEEVDGRAVLLRPLPRSRGWRGFVDRLLHRLSANRIRLDEVGTFAWSRLDGRRTVAEVAGLLRAEFGDRVDPAEERLGHLVRLMRREGLVGYPGWDDPV